MSLLKYTIFVGLALFASMAQGAGLYDSKSPVIQLTDKNFASQVFGSEHVWLVEFYAPWCGHCKNLAPEYNKAAANLKGIVKVGAINCDEEKSACGEFGIQGFPTIKLFPSKLTPVKGKKDAFRKEPKDYQGARSAAAMANYALGELPNFVEKVTAAKVEKFLSNELPKALLFSNKDKTSDLYKALAIDFRGRMVLGEARNTDAKLVEEYKVTSFPTLVVVPKEGEPIKFDGKLGHETLTKFLEPHAGPAPKQQQQQSSSGSSKNKKDDEPAAPEAEAETGEVYEIKSQADWDARCGNRGGLCAVAVLDPVNTDAADVTKYKTVLTQLGEKWKGKFRLMTVNGIVQKEFTRELGISEQYPSLVVLNPKKLKYTPFLGAFDVEAISEYFESVLRGKRTYSFTMPKFADEAAPAGDNKQQAKTATAEETKPATEEKAPEQAADVPPVVDEKPAEKMAHASGQTDTDAAERAAEPKVEEPPKVEEEKPKEKKAKKEKKDKKDKKPKKDTAKDEL